MKYSEKNVHQRSMRIRKLSHLIIKERNAIVINCDWSIRLLLTSYCLMFLYVLCSNFTECSFLL